MKNKWKLSEDITTGDTEEYIYLCLKKFKKIWSGQFTQKQ